MRGIYGVVHNLSSSWQKFLSSRIVIIEHQWRFLLGGLGACSPPPLPTGNFYILSPQKQNLVDSEHKFPIMSVPKVIVSFQFYLYKLCLQWFSQSSRLTFQLSSQVASERFDFTSQNKFSLARRFCIISYCVQYV